MMETSNLDSPLKNVWSTNGLPGRLIFIKRSRSPEAVRDTTKRPFPSFCFPYLENHDVQGGPLPIYVYMDVSENSGTPKSSVLLGFSIINHPFWSTPIFWKHAYIYMINLELWRPYKWPKLNG